MQLRSRPTPSAAAPSRAARPPPPARAAALRGAAAAALAFGLALQLGVAAAPPPAAARPPRSLAAREAEARALYADQLRKMNAALEPVDAAPPQPPPAAPAGQPSSPAAQAGTQQRRMATTATRSKNTISLKGSAAIVAEYFNFAVNNILFQRGIYPNDSFKQETHYGLSIMVSKDEGLAKYLATVTKQMSTWLEEGALQRLVLVISSAVGSREVLERWTFVVETDGDVLQGKAAADKPRETIMKEIQAVVRQITASVTFLPLLEDPCTFDLLVYTHKESSVPTDWEESDPRYISNSEDMKLRSFTTKVHKVDTSVSYKRGAAAMSLFAAREWWSTRLGGEEFDQGGLVVANIDNDPSGDAKIVTGSLAGVLRVHQPHGRGYHVEDVLLEAELEGSVLQLAAGRFLGGPELRLAVLHPRKLAVFALRAVGGSYLQLDKLYDHALDRTAANMATGCFGGAGGGPPQGPGAGASRAPPRRAAPRRAAHAQAEPPPPPKRARACAGAGVEHIAVQSLDGELAVFEGEALAFARRLPDFLLPGPLAYVAAADSFVTSTAALELVSYTYSGLAAAGGGAGAGGKRVQADWTVVLGEAALDIRTGRVSPGSRGGAPPDILVLAEHTFFVLDLRGALLVQRRLDYHPAAAWPFPSGGGGGGGGGAGAGAGADDAPPDSLLVGTHTRALMVYRGHALAWAARLELVPVALRVAELGGSHGMLVALDDAGRLAVLYLGTEPPRHAPAFAEARPLDYAAMEAERRALLAKIRAADADAPQHEPDGSAAALVLRAQDVCVSVLAPPPVVALQQQVLLPELPPASRAGRGEPRAVRIVLQAPASCGGAAGVPSANTAEVVATYRVAGDTALCSAQLTLELPMCLFCQVVPPIKAAAFKVTLNTNREPVQLTALFGDMLVQASPAHAEALSRAQGANVLSFVFAGGQDDVLELVDAHFAARRRLADAGAALEAREAQFRAVQKRLLVRYRIEQGQAQLADAAQALGAGVQLLLLLTRYRYALSDKEYELLRCVLSPVVQDGADDVSWEEMTEAATTHLLRTALARSAKDTAAAAPALAPAPDTARLKKHPQQRPARSVAMPKNKGKGGKNRRRGKNENEEKRELIFKEDGQEYAQVLRMLGNGRLEAQCIDGVKRLCHIRGKMRKKVWVNQGDIVLVGLREYQDAKGDVILKYMADEARSLKQYGELPENIRVNDTDAMMEGDENENAEFFDFDDIAEI
ncbi:bbs9 [Scenedesmus sp. PABB004]|nr:bbs9 [Scenedesmus sp. PABB004]